MTNTTYIGGEFPFSEISIHKKTDYSLYFPENNNIYFETGTDSLAYILSSIKKKKVSIWIPTNYCMSTITRVQNKINTKAIFVKKYSNIDFLKHKISKQDIIIFVHFNRFDINGQQKICKLINKKNEIFLIEDFVHAPLEIKNYKGSAAFNSLRKFFPINLSTCYTRNNKLRANGEPSKYFLLKNDAMKSKANYLILNKFSAEEENKYILKFREAEKELFNDKDIRLAQESEIQLLKKINFNNLLKKRIKNYTYLFKNLNGIVEIIEGNYMFFIIKTERREDLREVCFLNGIFPAIHWPDSNSIDSNNTLSFHVDHRYTLKDMDRILSIIKKYN